MFYLSRTWLNQVERRRQTTLFFIKKHMSSEVIWNDTKLKKNCMQENVCRKFRKVCEWSEYFPHKFWSLEFMTRTSDTNIALVQLFGAVKSKIQRVILISKLLISWIQAEEEHLILASWYVNYEIQHYTQKWNRSLDNFLSFRLIISTKTIQNFSFYIEDKNTLLKIELLITFSTKWFNITNNFVDHYRKLPHNTKLYVFLLDPKRYIQHASMNSNVSFLIEICILKFHSYELYVS